MGCIHSVNNAEMAIVEHCGKFNRVANPGLLILPCPCWCTVRGTISTRIQQLNVECETKTNDNVFTTIIVAVQYEVLREKIYEAFYRLSNAHSQIRSYVFDVVRGFVPSLSLDEVFESKEDIAIAVKERLDLVMKSYGYFIHQTLIVDVTPDVKVKNAMNEINKSRRMRMAAIEKAEAEKVLLVKRAEAEAESKYLSGSGIARQRKAIIDGLRTSVSEFQANLTDMNAKDVLELVLLTQYFDTLESIGNHSESNTLFLNHNPGALASLSKELKKGLI